MVRGQSPPEKMWKTKFLLSSSLTLSQPHQWKTETPAFLQTEETSDTSSAPALSHLRRTWDCYPDVP